MLAEVEALVAAKEDEPDQEPEEAEETAADPLWDAVEIEGIDGIEDVSTATQFGADSTAAKDAAAITMALQAGMAVLGINFYDVINRDGPR